MEHYYESMSSHQGNEVEDSSKSGTERIRSRNTETSKNHEFDSSFTSSSDSKSSKGTKIKTGTIGESDEMRLQSVEVTPPPSEANQLLNRNEEEIKEIQDINSSDFS
jgi:hypothetical protein